MSSSATRLLLGALTGVLAMLGMIRLAANGFERGLSPMAWAVVLLAMVPFVGYAAWRARHGRLSGRGMVALVALDLVGYATVWWATFGPVLALACALGAFVVIWVHDWPARAAVGPDRFVAFEELGREDDGDEDARLRSGQ